MSPDLALHSHRIPCHPPTPQPPRTLTVVRLSSLSGKWQEFTDTQVSHFPQFLGLVWGLPRVDTEGALQVVAHVRAPCASLSTLAALLLRGAEWWPAEPGAQPVQPLAERVCPASCCFLLAWNLHQPQTVGKPLRRSKHSLGKPISMAHSQPCGRAPSPLTTVHSPHQP